MDEAALRILLNNLAKSRSLLDAWLTVWTLLVGIGVVAEVAFVIHRHLEATAAWRRGSDRTPDKPSTLWFLLELIAVALVAVGVSGELVVEARVGSIETQIADANQQRSLLRQQQSSNVKQFAQGAAEAAQRAKAAADEAEAELKIVRAAASTKARTIQTRNISPVGETAEVQIKNGAQQPATSAKP